MSTIVSGMEVHEYATVEIIVSQNIITKTKQMIQHVLFLIPCGNLCSLCWRHCSISAAVGDAERVLHCPQCPITRGLKLQGNEEGMCTIIYAQMIFD